MSVTEYAYGTEYLLPGSYHGIEELRLDVLEVGQLRLVERAQRAAGDQRLDRVAGRHEHVVAGGAGGELGEQFLVVRVVVLHQPAFARRLEALDRLLGDVVVPVVQVELVGTLRRGLLLGRPSCRRLRRPSARTRRARAPAARSPSRPSVRTRSRFNPPSPAARPARACRRRRSSPASAPSAASRWR